jgi:hypothetical protein
MSESMGRTPKSAYRYNRGASRYIDARGRFVPQQSIRDELDRSIEQSQRRMRDASESMRTGATTLAEWQTIMMDEIRASHLASHALARGGWAQMTAADYGRAGRAIRTQYDFLQKFAEQVASGAQRLDGTLTRRALMYLDAARGHYEDIRRREHEIRAFDEERRTLHAKDSCVDCVRYASLGWSPIGTLPRIGDSVCRTKCHCTFEYRIGSAVSAG